MLLLDTILDIFFPINCLECGKSGQELCFVCISSSPTAERECEKWIFPIFDYRHPTIKKSITELKYRGKRGLAKTFAKELYGRIVEELSELSVMENFRDVLVIPIPLSSARRRERGFNQAELICKELVKFDKNINFKLETEALVRIKDGQHQAHMENRSERLKNIVGSFAVKHAELVKNRNIILIDDVTTTGATLSEAKKVLKQAGARKVIAFTIAH